MAGNISDIGSNMIPPRPPGQSRRCGVSSRLNFPVERAARVRGIGIKHRPLWVKRAGLTLYQSIGHLPQPESLAVRAPVLLHLARRCARVSLANIKRTAVEPGRAAPGYEFQRQFLRQQWSFIWLP